MTPQTRRLLQAIDQLRIMQQLGRATNIDVDAVAEARQAWERGRRGRD